MGSADVGGRTLDRYVRRINPKAPRLGHLYVKFGQRYGVDSDVAFAQTIYETHAFTFGGDVLPRQNNFSGLGATGLGERGLSFATPTEGVRAQIEHLYAYATREPLPIDGDPIDPRFTLVERGSADNAEELSGRWAQPGYEPGDYDSLEEAGANGDTYGHLIAYIERDLRDEVAEPSACERSIRRRFRKVLDEIEAKVRRG